MHALIGVRVIDAIDEDDGGRILSSEGGVGERGVSWEKTGVRVRWVDCTGELGGNPVGVTAMPHLSHSPIAVYARAYGTIFVNPTPDSPITIEKGNVLRFGVRFYGHDGISSTNLLDSLWEEFGTTDLNLDNALPAAWSFVTAGQ
jgi:hypothetical protein